jgi:hypothetical protein
MAMKILLAGMLLAVAAASHSAPLTVQAGDSWVFTIKDGQPADAHKVEATAKPAKGQLMVTVRAVMGTNMIMTNNSPVAYTFRAEIFRAGKPAGARPCTLPANGEPIFEQWPQEADAVRISNFRASGTEGRC